MEPLRAVLMSKRAIYMCVSFPGRLIQHRPPSQINIKSFRYLTTTCFTSQTLQTIISKSHIHDMADSIYDVLIIGGGPAGLSLAGSLARQLHTALILDSATYRNERGQHMHNVPGWDHRDPADFRAKLREDLNARYASIQYRAATIESVRKLDDYFEAVDQEVISTREGRLDWRPV